MVVLRLRKLKTGSPVSRILITRGVRLELLVMGMAREPEAVLGHIFRARVNPLSIWRVFYEAV